MTDRSAETNLQIYDSPEVVDHYAQLCYLTACERVLFETFVRPGGAVVDLGVGGGRTTAYLANRASRYVGVDNAAAMVRFCRASFPHLEFVVADAANLSAFPDASFDVVVFAFNGIDYVLPDSARRSCFEHIHRILKPGGVVIFSSHNARAIFVRPHWNKDRLRRAARRYSLGSHIVYLFLLALMTLTRSLLAGGWSAGLTVRRVLKRVPSRAFWHGEGSLVDSAHGGLLTHYSNPKRVIAEMGALPLRPERILGDDYPQPSHPYATDWYYYVFTKPYEM